VGYARLRQTNSDALTSMTKLMSLHLEGNHISTVSALAKLTNMQALGLADNMITDISPLTSTSQLTGLDLWNTQLTDISPLLAFSKLCSELILEGNPLNAESLNVHVPQLKARAVEVR